jgi:xanthine dehydrogenase accessory factor
MKELRDILERLRSWPADAADACAIATVIEVRGSAFRRPGARMLIAADGRLVGSVSGGCLEADVCQRAADVITSGVPQILTYDTTSDADIVWGLGLGCNGIVRVLVEPVRARTLPAYLPFIAESLDRGEHATVATITRGASAAAAAGQRVLLREDGGIAATDIADTAWLTRIVEGTRRALEDRATRLLSCTDETTGSEIEIFSETVKPPVPLVIFGSGDDAAMVSRLAKTLGWHVTVVDRRPSYLTRERLPEADALILSEPEAIATAVPLTPRTMALVMTHNYLQDRAILETLLPRGLTYIGQLGPRRRTERLLQELAEEHGSSTYGAHSENASRVHGPVGLDLGAETPEEIALAIVAEIQAVTAHHEAGFLKDRPGPIHLPASAEPARA